jgi:hypothetical protein
MHNISTTTTYFIFLVIFCVGAAIGAWVERALKKRSNPPPVLPPSNTNSHAEADDVEILSAWRTRSNKIWLAMDGTRLNDKADLQPGQYQRLLNLVIDLRPWLETARPAAPAPVETQPPMHAPANAAAVTPPVMRAVAPDPAMIPPPIPAGKKNGKPAAEELPPAPLLDSIIQQIDKVLQARLAATGAFKDRGIQLVEGPGGIVIVKDGDNRYEGIDGIPDPEVKALIRQAVTDWEKGPK